MSNDNPTMLDISSYTHLTQAQAQQILNRFDSIREANRGAVLCYTLAQLARLRLLVEHTDSVDFDNAIVDDGLDELGYLVHFTF